MPVDEQKTNASQDAERFLKEEAGNDPDMIEFAKEEISALAANLDSLSEQMKLLLLPRDPLDDKNVMLEIRAGGASCSHDVCCGCTPRAGVEQCMLSSLTKFLK